MKFSKTKKALISAAIILSIALITSLVATPASSGDSRFIIFLLISSSILFIDEDSCSKDKGVKAYE